MAETGVYRVDTALLPNVIGAYSTLTITFIGSTVTADSGGAVTLGLLYANMQEGSPFSCVFTGKDVVGRDATNRPMLVAHSNGVYSYSLPMLSPDPPGWHTTYNFSDLSTKIVCEYYVNPSVTSPIISVTSNITARATNSMRYTASTTLPELVTPSTINGPLTATVVLENNFVGAITGFTATIEPVFASMPTVGGTTAVQGSLTLPTGFTFNNHMPLTCTVKIAPTGSALVIMSPVDVSTPTDKLFTFNLTVTTSATLNPTPQFVITCNPIVKIGPVTITVGQVAVNMVTTPTNVTLAMYNMSGTAPLATPSLSKPTLLLTANPLVRNDSGRPSTMIFSINNLPLVIEVGYAVVVTSPLLYADNGYTCTASSMIGGAINNITVSTTSSPSTNSTSANNAQTTITFGRRVPKASTLTITCSLALNPPSGFTYTHYVAVTVDHEFMTNMTNPSTYTISYGVIQLVSAAPFTATFTPATVSTITNLNINFTLSSVLLNSDIITLSLPEFGTDSTNSVTGCSISVNSASPSTVSADTAASTSDITVIMFQAPTTTVTALTTVAVACNIKTPRSLPSPLELTMMLHNKFGVLVTQDTATYSLQGDIITVAATLDDPRVGVASNMTIVITPERGFANGDVIEIEAPGFTFTPVCSTLTQGAVLISGPAGLPPSIKIVSGSNPVPSNVTIICTDVVPDQPAAPATTLLVEAIVMDSNGREVGRGNEDVEIIGKLVVYLSLVPDLTGATSTLGVQFLGSTLIMPADGKFTIGEFPVGMSAATSLSCNFTGKILPNGPTVTQQATVSWSALSITVTLSGNSPDNYSLGDGNSLLQCAAFVNPLQAAPQTNMSIVAFNSANVELNNAFAQLPAIGVPPPINGALTATLTPINNYPETQTGFTFMIRVPAIALPQAGSTSHYNGSLTLPPAVEFLTNTTANCAMSLVPPNLGVTINAVAMTPVYTIVNSTQLLFTFAADTTTLGLLVPQFSMVCNPIIYIPESITSTETANVALFNQPVNVTASPYNLVGPATIPPTLSAPVTLPTPSVDSWHRSDSARPGDFSFTVSLFPVVLEAGSTIVLQSPLLYAWPNFTCSVWANSIQIDPVSVTTSSKYSISPNSVIDPLTSLKLGLSVGAPFTYGTPSGASIKISCTGAANPSALGATDPYKHNFTVLAPNDFPITNTATVVLGPVVAISVSGSMLSLTPPTAQSANVTLSGQFTANTVFLSSDFLQVTLPGFGPPTGANVHECIMTVNEGSPVTISFSADQGLTSDDLVITILFTSVSFNIVALTTIGYECKINTPRAVPVTQTAAVAVYNEFNVLAFTSNANYTLGSASMTVDAELTTPVKDVESELTVTVTPSGGIHDGDTITLTAPDLVFTGSCTSGTPGVILTATPLGSTTFLVNTSVSGATVSEVIIVCDGVTPHPPAAAPVNVPVEVTVTDPNGGLVGIADDNIPILSVITGVNAAVDAAPRYALEPTVFTLTISGVAFSLYSGHIVEVNEMPLTMSLMTSPVTVCTLSLPVASGPNENITVPATLSGGVLTFTMPSTPAVRAYTFSPGSVVECDKLNGPTSPTAASPLTVYGKDGPVTIFTALAMLPEFKWENSFGQDVFTVDFVPTPTHIADISTVLITISVLPELVLNTTTFDFIFPLPYAASSVNSLSDCETSYGNIPFSSIVMSGADATIHVQPSVTPELGTNTNLALTCEGFKQPRFAVSGLRLSANITTVIRGAQPSVQNADIPDVLPYNITVQVTRDTVIGNQPTPLTMTFPEGFQWDLEVGDAIFVNITNGGFVFTSVPQADCVLQYANGTDINITLATFSAAMSTVSIELGDAIPGNNEVLLRCGPEVLPNNLGTPALSLVEITILSGGNPGEISGTGSDTQDCVLSSPRMLDDVVLTLTPPTVDSIATLTVDISNVHTGFGEYNTVSCWLPPDAGVITSSTKCWFGDDEANKGDYFVEALTNGTVTVAKAHPDLFVTWPAGTTFTITCTDIQTGSVAAGPWSNITTTITAPSPFNGTAVEIAYNNDGTLDEITDYNIATGAVITFQDALVYAQTSINVTFKAGSAQVFRPSNELYLVLPDDYAAAGNITCTLQLTPQVGGAAVIIPGEVTQPPAAPAPLRITFTPTPPSPQLPSGHVDGLFVCQNVRNARGVAFDPRYAQLGIFSIGGLYSYSDALSTMNVDGSVSRVAASVSSAFATLAVPQLSPDSVLLPNAVVRPLGLTKANVTSSSAAPNDLTTLTITIGSIANGVSLRPGELISFTLPGDYSVATGAMTQCTVKHNGVVIPGMTEVSKQASIVTFVPFVPLPTTASDMTVLVCDHIRNPPDATPLTSGMVVTVTTPHRQLISQSLDFTLPEVAPFTLGAGGSDMVAVRSVNGEYQYNVRIKPINWKFVSGMALRFGWPVTGYALTSSTNCRLVFGGTTPYGMNAKTTINVETRMVQVVIHGDYSQIPNSADTVMNVWCTPVSNARSVASLSGITVQAVNPYTNAIYAQTVSYAVGTPQPAPSLTNPWSGILDIIKRYVTVPVVTYDVIGNLIMNFDSDMGFPEGTIVTVYGASQQRFAYNSSIVCMVNGMIVETRRDAEDAGMFAIVLTDGLLYLPNQVMSFSCTVDKEIITLVPLRLSSSDDLAGYDMTGTASSVPAASMAVLGGKELLYQYDGTVVNGTANLVISMQSVNASLEQSDYLLLALPDGFTGAASTQCSVAYSYNTLSGLDTSTYAVAT